VVRTVITLTASLDWTVAATRSTASISARASHARVTALVALGAALGGGLGLAFMLSFWLARPISSLEAYAARFELPLRGGTAVDTLAKENGRYVAAAGDRRFEADNVVIATGVFQKPHLPGFAGELDPGIRQLHSNDYRNLSQLQPGPVLVVGASHSGADIAFEAASDRASSR